MPDITRDDHEIRRDRALRRRKAEIDDRLVRLRQDRLNLMTTRSEPRQEPTTDLERRVARARDRAHRALTQASESYERATQASEWAAGARDRAADSSGLVAVSQRRAPDHARP
jgi:hypothetical protein